MLKFVSQNVKNMHVNHYNYITFTFTFSHLADAFIQSDLQLGNT